MSKPISFGFGKSKTSAAPAKASISIPTRKPAPTKSRPGTALHDDSDNEEEQAPQHESVTGFSSSGVILSQPVQEKSERVIKNPGNSDWRKRGRGGKNLLPEEVQAARNGDVVMIERDEVSKESGLQFAEPGTDGETAVNGEAVATDKRTQEVVPAKPLTDDEVALQALLDDGSGKPRSNAVIEQLGNNRLSARDETEDFRTDVASRPDSSTLEDYAAMPVEEFGLAMLRGMGLKRRANGEVISLNGDKPDENPRKVRKQEGFLGIGAKPAPGADIELGAWGKADMRKNNRGEGFFTPLMRENKITGERITEEELQKRMKDSKNRKGEEDWRERRDRNLERSGRDKNGEQKALTNGDEYHDQMNDFSRQTSSRRDRDDSSHSRREREKEDREYDSSRSRRERSRSRDRRRRGDDSNDNDDYDHDGRRRDKHRDKHRDDERYDSTSSKRSGHRERDRDRDRDRDRERERVRERDRDDDRRHRDRR